MEVNGIEPIILIQKFAFCYTASELLIKQFYQNALLTSIILENIRVKE